MGAALAKAGVLVVLRGEVLDHVGNEDKRGVVESGDGTEDVFTHTSCTTKL